MSKNETYFPSLDGLRFIAFFAVFLMHAFSPAYNSLHIDNDFVNALFHFFANGESGVSLFFVLSGFLITYLLINEQNSNGKIDIGFFYMRRVLRIWPLYYVLVIIVVVLFPLVREAVSLPGKTHDSNGLLYFLFLGNFDIIHLRTIGGQGFAPLGITWSVAVEEQFYLLWPLLLSVVRNQGRLWIIAAVLVTSFCFRIVQSGDETVLYYHSFSLFGDMAVGGLAAYCIVNIKGFKCFFQNRSPQGRIISYSLGFSLLLLNSWLQYEHLLYFYSLYRLPETLFFIFIILDQSFSLSQKGKLVNNQFITRWGKYTYGLYLLHPLALYVFDAVFFKLTGFSNKEFIPLFALGLLALPLTLTMAYVSYHILEYPFLRLKNKFTVISSANPATR